MATRQDLQRAKAAKNDEWYTQYRDVEAEMSHYPLAVFAGKSIFCPCDGADSAFTRYFKANFERLHLSRLIATQYSADGRGQIYSYDGRTETQ